MLPLSSNANPGHLIPVINVFKPWAFGGIANNTASYFMARCPFASDILVLKCLSALTLAIEKKHGYQMYECLIAMIILMILDLLQQ